jgi:hypothetical protein
LEHRDSTRGTGLKVDLTDMTGTEVDPMDIELDKEMEEEAR